MSALPTSQNRVDYAVQIFRNLSFEEQEKFFFALEESKEEDMNTCSIHNCIRDQLRLLQTRKALEFLNQAYGEAPLQIEKSQHSGFSTSFSGSVEEVLHPTPNASGNGQELKLKLVRALQERDAWCDKFAGLSTSPIDQTDSVDSKSNTSAQRASFKLRLCNNDSCQFKTLEDGLISSEPITSNVVTLDWTSRPSKVFILKKPNQPTITKFLADLSVWLIDSQKLQVFVESTVAAELPELGLLIWKPQVEVDFAITLGGDGTVLFLSHMFPNHVPPVLSFSMGSLGFLTAFDTFNATEVIQNFVSHGGSISLRDRLDCSLHPAKCPKSCSTSRIVVLNEVVVDRGMSSYLTNLDCFVDDLPCTTVQGDGCIISTPTGSTAYNMAAGGSICHPQVPAIILTPISPHSLSFRPVIFQHSITFKVVVSEHARDGAWVSFDGQNRTRLNHGDSVSIKLSRYPIPIVCEYHETAEWLGAVANRLLWNVREKQKSFSFVGSPAAIPVDEHQLQNENDPGFVLPLKAAFEFPL